MASVERASSGPSVLGPSSSRPAGPLRYPRPASYAPDRPIRPDEVAAVSDRRDDPESADALRAHVQSSLRNHKTVVMENPELEELHQQRKAFLAELAANPTSAAKAPQPTQPWIEEGTRPAAGGGNPTQPWIDPSAAPDLPPQKSDRVRTWLAWSVAVLLVVAAVVAAVLLIRRLQSSGRAAASTTACQAHPWAGEVSAVRSQPAVS